MTSVTPFLATATIAVGLLTAVPAAADPPTDPVSGLVGGLVGPPGDHQRAQRRDLGHTHADDGVLRMGCRNYPYRYVLKIRSNDWSLETFLDDRTEETIASGAYAAGPDRKRMTTSFRFCRYNTVPGRFTIRAKLSWYTDSGSHVAWLKPSHFRLRRP
ncbi:hypothetical protein [Nocardioides pyridinolyticus]